MNHACFIGCEPRGDDDERFFVLVGADITSYGHTVDAHTREKYPEDWPHTLEIRERGRDFGCWHSQMCPDGELTAFDPAECREISREEFEKADAESWPTIEDELTTSAPAFALYTIGPGGPAKVWDSVEGDVPTRADRLGEDGDLVDASEMAREAGYSVPVAITRPLWNLIDATEEERAQGQSTNGRLWDVLWMSRVYGSRQGDASRIYFPTSFYRLGRGRPGGQKTEHLCIEIGPGDEGEPVITIGFRNDFPKETTRA